MNQWSAVRARLFNAIFSHDSVANGDLIYHYLQQLEQLATTDQEDDLEQCRELVQQWSDTWYPKFPS